MRFHGMVGDRVPISTTGQAWRPPDYITSATRKLRPDHEAGHDKDPAQKSEHSKRLNKSVICENENHSKRYSKPKYHMKETRPRRQFQYHRVREDGCLPFPSTCIRNNRRHPKLTVRQRIFAITIAILLAFGLLASLVVILTKQLENVAARVDAQNEILRHSHHFSEKFPDVQKQSSRVQTRKLLEQRDDKGSKKALNQHSHFTNRGFLVELFKSVTAIQHIINILRSPHENTPTFTASLFYNSARAPIPNTPGFFTRPLPHQAEAAGKIKSLQEELQKIHDDLLLGRVPAPLQISQGEANTAASGKRATDVSTPGEIGSTMKAMNEHTRYHPNPDLARKELKVVESPPALASNVLHSNALTIVGNVSNPETPMEPNNSMLEQSRNYSLSQSPEPQPVDERTQRNAVTASTRRATQSLQFAQHRHNMFPESVEVWALPRAKSLCRLFNVARLPDGRLVLPKWMKKHSEFLSSRCGIRAPLFAIESMSSRGTTQFDSSILRAAIESPFEVDMKNSGRDLCGTIAPRNHMPHFVTDIFLPLVASETLLGSGKMYPRSSTLLPTGAKGIDVRSVPTFSDFKPSLLVFEETWSQPSSEWVPRLAQFFLQSRVGFTLLRIGKEKAPQTLSPKSTVATFRSVVTSNIKTYFPLALFGPEGRNIVLDVNGISRSPAWTTRGIKDTPCRVTITVLTRKGPRALLKLDDLQKSINMHSQKAGIRTIFQAVDFEEKSFDDQVSIMQETNILIATHGAGNANFIFMKPSAAVIEIFPFSYKAGPFDSFARIFGLDYKFAMSSPQTDVFKECMHRHESNQRIKQLAFSRWDKAVLEEKASPWVHRLEFEKEFGEPGKSEGMTTRMCVRLQELEFNIDAVSQMAIDSATSQCLIARHT